MKYFKDILEENGVILSKDNRPNILTKEQSLIIRDIEKALTRNEDDASRFISSFKTCAKKSEFLHKLLLPTLLLKGTKEIPDTDSLTGLIQQESLVRIFFQINCVQSEIMDFVLEEATEQVSDENEEGADFRLMLNAMKYLPFINTSDVLTQKLLDMVEIGTFGAQLEILNSIPEIIPDAQYESTAKQLIRILENNNELTGAIVDCLNSLNLSNDTRLEIQQYIIDRLLSSASIHVYPILFDFLTSDCKPINLPAILLKCRDALNEIMKNERMDKDRESKKVIIMKKLHMSASSKVQYEGWMNLLINIRNFNATHKPVDIIILTILHSTGSNRKQSVEKLIKRHVKGGLLKKQHLEVVFQKYFIKQLFHDYFQSIIDIASSLLRHPIDILSTEFASAIFILLFENEIINRVQRQDIIHTLILLTSSWESKSVGDILKILLDLSKGNNLKNHVVQLMGLLEKVDSFELKDIKQVYELLCSMTCSAADEANSNLKDELHMLIRKQISSAKRHLKQRGIVAAIVMAKYIATTLDEQELSEDDSFSDISHLPVGAAQESASLLELASSAASCIPELMGLYYDQLASMLLRPTNLDKYFMGWLQHNVQTEFENTFTVRGTPGRINDIHIYSQYCLNDVDEMEEVFSVNIAELTMRATHTKSIILLAPMFRMFRTLCQKNQDNLGGIDALLGCGVVLPELEDVSLYDADQIKLVADSVFHCVNWFREAISAFIKCSNRRLRTKLIERLAHLVHLEEQLNKCLERIPNHKLPSSYFYNALISVVRGSPIKTKPEAKISRPRKKMKTITGEALDFLNETVASTSIAPTPRKKPTSTSSKRSTHQIPKPDFREIDTDLIILLKYPLNIADEDDSVSSQQTSIDITAFQYVLNDIVAKLSLIINNKNLGMSNLNDINPVSLITDCIKLSPSVYSNFKKISGEIAQLKEKVDERDDHIDLYSPEAKTLKNCFHLSLEYFTLIFSWSGFGNTKNLKLLRDYLRALIDEESSSQSAAHLSREVANKLITCADQCIHLQPAVCLVKAMQALYKINPENHEIKKKIAAVSGKFLNKKWYNTSGELDGGKVMYENLDVLLKAYLNGANIKTISGIVGTLQKQAGDLRSKDDYLERLESINKASFHILYRNLCSCTLDRVTLEVNSLTNNEHLVLWKTTGVIMQGLMAIVTAQNTRNNYNMFLKKSINILNVFLSHGIPILEIMLKSKTDEVVEILKTLQTTTRFLHHLCCTSKLTKDSSIMACVPKFRLTLETLIFRVKGALVANDCSEAFWMGNLKNKDLDGDEILTQSTLSTGESQSEEAEEEELPSEDSDGDILALEEVNVNRNGEERSASEVYD